MMTYKINGKVVTQEEFNANNKGLDYGKPLKVFGKTFTEFQSPIDGKVIASREQLRNHEKRHNVVQVGDEWAN